MSVDTSVDGVEGVEGVSSVCRECVESVEPGLKPVMHAKASKMDESSRIEAI